MALSETEKSYIEKDFLFAFKAFQEGTFSKEEVKKMINDHFKEFCDEHNLDKHEAFEFLKEVVERKTATTYTMDYKPGLNAISLDDDDDQR